MSISALRTYSLPKTQPTRSYSKMPSCQKIGDKSLQKSLSKNYIHHIDIDYGHLQEPARIWQNIPENKLKKLQKLTVQCNDKYNEYNLQTLRYQFKNRTEQKPKNKTQQKNKNKTQWKNQAKTQQKNSINVSQFLQQTQPTIIKTHRQNPEQKKNRRIQLKLKQIYALQKKVQQISTNQQQLFGNLSNEKQGLGKKFQNSQKYKMNQQSHQDSPINKINTHQQMQQISTIPNMLSIPTQSHQSINSSYLHKNSTIQKSNKSSFRNSQKKVLHSRIIKTYVAGNKMQLKLINYPDDTEYLKLSGNKNNKIKSKKASYPKY